MKKIIVIDEKGKRIDERKTLINNKIVEWIIYMIGYALVLITVSLLFDSFNITNKYFGLYALLGAIIIYVLNQTIRPILFYLTLPITALTMGLFYPFLNVLILYITSFILGKENFYIDGFIIPFFISLLISVLNLLMEGMIIKPIIRKGYDYE